MTGAVLTFGLAILSGAAQGTVATPPTGPRDRVEEGVRLVEGGDFDKGIVVLEAALRGLAGRQEGRARARAYLYLGIGYLGLAQLEAAKERFRAALAEAGDLTVSADEFPPKVVDLFEQARREMVLTRAKAATPAGRLAVGSRIRLLSTEAGEITGTVLAIDAAAITVAAGDRDRLRVRRDSITQLDLSTVRRGNAARGFLIGAALGAGLAASPVDPDDCGSDSFNSCSRAEAILGGVALAALGAGIGSLIKSDSWVRVDLAVPAGGPAPRSRGEVRLALSLRF